MSRPGSNIVNRHIINNPNIDRTVPGPVDGHTSSSRPLFDEGDQFFDLYNSLGADYQKQLDPLMNYNYQLGGWDRIGNWLGFRTKEDSYRESLQQQARLTALQLAGDEFQNNYNSEAARVAREHAAGLNPDLSGSVDDGHAASGAEQPASPVGTDFLKPAVGDSGLPAMFGLANSTISSIVNFGKIFSEIGLTKQKSAGEEINNLQSALTTVRDIASSVAPEGISTIIQDGEFLPGKSDTDLRGVVTRAVTNKFKEYSPEAQKYLNRAWDVAKNDPAVWKRWFDKTADVVESRSRSIVSQSVHGAFNIGTKLINSTNNINLNHMIHMANVNLVTQRALADLHRISAENQAEYQQWLHDNHVPEDMARADAAKYLENRAASEYQLSVANARKAWLDELLGLKKLAPKNPQLAWLINGVINGNYSPLGSYSGAVHGPFGIGANGSFNAPISPYGSGFGYEFGNLVSSDPSTDKERTPYFSGNGNKL